MLSDLFLELMKKSLLLCLSLLLFVPVAFSQNDTTVAVNPVTPDYKPVRIGVKFGAPIVVGLNLEVLTPLVKHRLAVDVDGTSFGFKVKDEEDIDFTFTYLEGGLNFYLRKPAKGPYLGLAYGNFNLKGTYYDPDKGEGEGEANLNLIHLKLGAKWGKGFYFRPEIGYTAILGDSKITIDYTDSDGDRTQVDESVPGILSSGILLNLGFGVAF